MCITALPPHLDSQEEIDAAFPDDRQYGDGWFGRLYTWFHKKTKACTAFGHRDIHWYHRFREWPITIFAVFGEGFARFENDYLAIKAPSKMITWYDSQYNQFYLSRIQAWVVWHIQIQWPLFLCFSFTIGDSMWMGYCGFKRDADKVYWLALFFGKGSK